MDVFFISGIEWWIATAIALGLILVVSVRNYLKLRFPVHIRRSVFWSIGILGLWISYVRPSIGIRTMDSAAVLQLDQDGRTTVDSLLKKVGKMPVFKDFNTLLAAPEFRDLDNLHVVGEGLSVNDLKRLKKVKVTHYPSVIPSGVLNLRLPPDITEHREWTLIGETRGQWKRVRLEGPGDRFWDTEVVDKGFAVKSKAPMAGDYLYKVILMNESDTLTESLPIHVDQEIKWRMMVIMASPSFEVNNFKKHWSELGHGFAIQNQISKDKYQTEFINCDRILFTSLDRKTLSSFDFVWMDLLSWNRLGAGKRNLILQTVEEDGVALILFPDEELQPKGLPGVRFAAGGEWSWTTDTGKLSFPAFQVNGKGLESVTFNSGEIGRSLSFGVGKIAFPLIGTSYRLLLVDQKETYQQFWSGLLSEIFVRPGKKIKYDLPDLMYAGDEVTVRIYSNSGKPVSVYLNDSIFLPVLGSPSVEGVFQGNFWPVVGWNKLKTETDSILFYAHPDNAWSTRRVVREQEVIISSHFSDRTAASAFGKEKRPWPWYIGWLLMMIGWGGLWLDERLF